MYPELSSIEICTYFVTWVSGVFYSVYHIYLLGNYLDYDSFGNFAPGWSFLGRRKDVSDYEWTTWIPFLYIILPWIVVQILGAEFIRWKNWKLLWLWYFIVTVVFLYFLIGPMATGFMILQPCILYGCVQLKSRAIIWIVSVGMLVAMCHIDSGMDWLNLPYELQYIVYVSVAWIQLRTISFCLDKLSNPTHRYTLLQLLAYCFYLPVLFYGPLILYEQFEAGVSRPFLKWTFWRQMTVFLNLLRFSGWLLIAELSLHYFYFNALQLHPDMVKKVGLWALYGLGYCMGQFFMVKYVVIYGLPATIARAEQINAPHHPKCIARIHLYSDMWRYFDRGLYTFLAKYIYIPCLGQNPHLLRKMMASFVCFVFVYVWHNTYLNVFVWSVLNFLGVSIEGICKAVGSTPVYKQWEKRLLSERNSRRFYALISSPLFIMSAISNFYFFAGYEIGNIFVNRLFAGTLLANTILLVFCYCCCQVSIEVSNWEQKRKTNEA